MKAIFLLLSCAFLINGLAASVIKFPFEDEKPEIQESENSFDSELNTFLRNDNSDENLISFIERKLDNYYPSTTSYPTSETTGSYPSSETTGSYPSSETTGSYPTTWSPTSSPQPTYSTTWETVTSTEPTVEPSTTVTTSRPTTPEPKPGRKNPQIYNNAVRSLGPFAGRLVNVVLNKQGKQDTVQENEIVYNLKS